MLVIIFLILEVTRDQKNHVQEVHQLHRRGQINQKVALDLQKIRKENRDQEVWHPNVQKVAVDQGFLSIFSIKLYFTLFLIILEAVQIEADQDQGKFIFYYNTLKKLSSIIF